MSASAIAFENAASRVLMRVLLRRWVRVLGRTALPAGLLFGGLLLGRVFGGVSAWVPVALFLAWVSSAAAWVWQRRPAHYAALALWDEAMGRSEAFASAWWFTRQPARSEAQERHIESQRALLEGALPHLANNLPLAPARALTVPAVFFILALFAGHLRPLAPGDTRLTDAMRDTAEMEGKKLAENTLTKKPLTGLSEQEKREVEKLKKDVQSTAKDIEQGSADTARGLLSDLEKRARDAEKLAQKLGQGAEAWASEKLVNALRSHADTADLGDAIASKNAAHSATAAQTLSDQLKQPDLPDAAQDRVALTLDDAARVSETEDRKRFAAQHILAAGDAMQKQDARAAAQEFEALAKKMSDTAQREQARRELEKLAQQLRDAGSRIAGQKGGGMENMAQAGKSENQPQQTSSANPQQMQAQQALQPPGLSQQQPQMSQPSPSTSGQQQTMSMAQADAQQQGQGQQGQQGQGAQGKPMLFAPVPGAKSEQQPSMLLQAPGMKLDQPPTGAVAMPGGPKAGNGTAKLDNTPTVPQKATKSSVVEARPTGEGPSSTRSIEGGVRTEASGRGSQATTLDLIKEQEAALDDSTLPATRREQVRRYFGELRKRFGEK